jgi:hypothetical protein
MEFDASPQARAMGARFWAPYPFRDWAGHQFLFRTSERKGGFPTMFGRVMFGIWGSERGNGEIGRSRSNFGSRPVLLAVPLSLAFSEHWVIFSIRRAIAGRRCSASAVVGIEPPDF